MYEDDKSVSDEEYYRRNFTNDYDLKDDDDIDWIEMAKFALPILIIMASVFTFFAADDEDEYTAGSSTYIYMGGAAGASTSQGFRSGSTRSFGSRSSARSGGFSSGKN